MRFKFSTLQACTYINTDIRSRIRKEIYERSSFPLVYIYMAQARACAGAILKINLERSCGRIHQLNIAVCMSR